MKQRKVVIWVSHVGSSCFWEGLVFQCLSSHRTSCHNTSAVASTFGHLAIDFLCYLTCLKMMQKYFLNFSTRLVICLICFWLKVTENQDKIGLKKIRKIYFSSLSKS
jgi:hypothetical protein